MLGARLIHGAVWENRAAGIISASGPSRHSAAKQRFGRFRKEADIKYLAGPAGSVANDPSRHFGRIGAVPYKRSLTAVIGYGFLA